MALVSARSVSVEAHARLHVCLIDMNGSLGRADGSVGIILSRPVVRVSAKRVESTSIDEPLAPFAERFFEAVGRRERVELRLEESFEAHVGLGSTTQLALSVARSLSELMGFNHSIRELATIMGRGGTSGIGVAGFEGGGSLIVDIGHRFGPGGKTSFAPSDHYRGVEPAKPLVKILLPTEWRFVVAIPKHGRRIYGEHERALFEAYTPIPEHEVAQLSRIVLVKLLPAAVEGDIEEFGEAVNMIQRVGFKRRELESQPENVKAMLDEGLRLGAVGAGMSSFGPAVYFLTKGERSAQSVAEGLASECEKIYVAQPWSGGATVSFS